MFNFNTGRFFIGDGNILYPSMRKGEFFETNFFRKLLGEDEADNRDLEIFHVKEHNLDNLKLDLDICFDTLNDFIEKIVLRADDTEILLSEVGIEKDSSVEYSWGKIEEIDGEVFIIFNNSKYIR